MSLTEPLPDCLSDAERYKKLPNGNHLLIKYAPDNIEDSFYHTIRGMRYDFQPYPASLLSKLNLWTKEPFTFIVTRLIKSAYTVLPTLDFATRYPDIESKKTVSFYVNRISRRRMYNIGYHYHKPDVDVIERLILLEYHRVFRGK